MSAPAQRLALVSMLSHSGFALLKLGTGIVGNSFALIADGVESLADIFSSLIVWSGLRFAGKRPDAEHPYGHGKGESLAAFVAALILGLSAVAIAVQAVLELTRPQTAPAMFTLPVIFLVLFGKEGIYRFLVYQANSLHSEALRVEAWNHRLDSLTTLAVLIGVLLSLFAGPAYRVADEIAALLIAGMIFFNAFRLTHPSLQSLLDADVHLERKERIRSAAEAVPAVRKVESLRLTRSGACYHLDIHLEVDGNLTVRDGHRIAHLVRDRLQADPELRLGHVFTHVEPFRSGEVPGSPRAADKN